MSDSTAPAAPPRPIRLEVFSDYTCPWCYVGWARLEKALASLPEGRAIEVEWRPFEIHPEVPIEGMPVEELPYPPDVWTRMQDALRAAAEAEGLEVGNRPKVANTHRALVASAWVQSEAAELFPAFHEGLFTAYFAEGRDLGDPEVLVDVAVAAGVDPVALGAALDSGTYESAVSNAANDARQMGITGTPTFVFDRRLAASGAQPAEVLLQALETVAGTEPIPDVETS